MRGLTEHEVRVLMATLQARRIEAAEAYTGTPNLDESSEGYWGGYMHGLDRAIAIAQNLINHSIDTPPVGYDVYCHLEKSMGGWTRVAWFDTEHNANRWAQHAMHQTYFGPDGRHLGRLEFVVRPCGVLPDDKTSR